MKDRESSLKWFPFWIDKWLFGSMRIEHTRAEMMTWLDLLAFASKDNGYIRANEEMGYPVKSLAGILQMDADDLESHLKALVKSGKLERQKTGVLRIATYNKYQLSARHKRRLQQGKSVSMSGKADIVSAKADSIREEKIREDKIKEDKKKEKTTTLKGGNNNIEKFKDKATAIQKTWNSFAVKEGFTEALKISESRKNKLRLRMNEGLFDIDKILAAAKKQPFLMGENERDWAITFDFIIANDSNFIKILELYYVRKEKKSWAERSDRKATEIMEGAPEKRKGGY